MQRKDQWRFYAGGMVYNQIRTGAGWLFALLGLAAMVRLAPASAPLVLAASGIAIPFMVLLFAEQLEGLGGRGMVQMMRFIALASLLVGVFRLGQILSWW